MVREFLGSPWCRERQAGRVGVGVSLDHEEQLRRGRNESTTSRAEQDKNRAAFAPLAPSVHPPHLSPAMSDLDDMLLAMAEPVERKRKAGKSKAKSSTTKRPRPAPAAVAQEYVPSLSLRAYDPHAIMCVQCRVRYGHVERRERRAAHEETQCEGRLRRG